jgi:GNAT superfamily N-acetyltransferase
MVTVRVRLARAADAGAIARVHLHSWRAAYAGVLPARYLTGLDPAELTQSWRGRLMPDSRGIWVAERDGEVIGFARAGACAGDDDSLVGFAGELSLLYVHPDHVGTGVGSALFRRADASLAAHPCYWLVVWVVEKNLEARGFYAHHGMRPDGERRTDRFQGTPVAVVRYAKPLNPAIDYEQLLASVRTDGR